MFDENDDIEMVLILDDGTDEEDEEIIVIGQQIIVVQVDEQPTSVYEVILFTIDLS